jgi:DnaK suppressor protein
MTKQELKDVKEKVVQEIDKTEKSIEDYRDMSRPISPENAIGRVSRMDAINNKSVTEAALRQAELKLINLHNVLSSSDGEDFGLCLKCQKPIPIGRILLMPQSRYCVNCAS